MITINYIKPGINKFEEYKIYKIGSKIGASDDVFDIIDTPKTNNKPIIALDIYNEDSVWNFREKVSLISNIPVYKQHMFTYINNKIQTLKYKIISDGLINININDIFNETNKILNIPVDSSLFNNNDNIQVESMEQFYTMDEINSKEFWLVNLDDFINYEQLQVLYKTDKFQFKFIYYGFIIKYWPVITYDVFINLILGENFDKIYPELIVNQEKYIYEKKIFDSFTKTKNYQTSIKTASISNLDNITNSWNDIIYKTKINITNLFNNLNTSETIPIIRIRIIKNGKMYDLTKINNKHEEAYDKVKAKINLMYYNTIIIVIKNEKDYIIMTLYENGYYLIKTFWNEDLNMNFTSIYEEVIKKINPIIQSINNMDRSVFDSIKHLNLISKYNTEFVNLTVSIFWKISVSLHQFSEIPKLLTDDLKSDIIRKSDKPNDSTQLNYLIYKSITEYDKNLMEKNLSSNQYEHLSDSKIRQRWNNMFGGKYMSFQHRATDIKIEVEELKEKEYNNFYKYITNLIIRLEKNIKSEKVDIKSSNILKLLKIKDPELYVFKQHGTDVVFSRICQKEHQAIPYFEEEYKQLDNKMQKQAVKYWNFTNNTPMYYVCSNSKYPYLNFITDQHPKGYCIPCCKKTQALDYTVKVGKETKKDIIYNTCMKTHMFTEENSGMDSRYIMNYGKYIEIGRISKLPEIFEKYILYNLEKQEMVGANENTVKTITLARYLSELVDVFENPDNNKEIYDKIMNSNEEIVISNNKLITGLYTLARNYINGVDSNVKYITKKQLIEGGKTKTAGYYIYGVPQNFQNIENIGIVYAIASSLNLELDMYIKKTIDFMQNNHEYFTIILSGKLVSYFQKPINLINQLKELFLSESIVLTNSNFYYWNEFFIEITKYCFNTTVILYDDMSIDITGTSIKIAEENINIVFINKFNNIDEIINSEGKYIVVLRKKRKTKNVFTTNYYYYPIFTIIPQIFFKNMSIEKKIYTISDDIIKISKLLIENAMESNKITENSTEITLELIINFANINNYEISKVYVNLSGNIYMCRINNILIPIKYTNFYNIKTIEKDYEPYKLENLCSLEEFKHFSELFNEYIIELSEAKGSFRTIYDKSDNPLKNRENKILPIYDLIKAENIIIMNNKIIGIQSNQNYYYFDPIIMNKPNILSFYKTLVSGYSICDFGLDMLSKHIKIILYNPETINKKIKNYEKQMDPLYEKYLNIKNEYNNFILKFIEIVDKERNKNLRTKIIKHIYENQALDELISGDDLEKIKFLVNKYNDKKALIEEINSLIFNFDKITLNKLKQYSDNYLILNKTEKKERLLKIKETIVEIMESYKSDSENLKNLVDLFAHDIINPIKRDFILNSIFLYQTNFIFKKNKYEEIYIKEI